MSQYHYTHFVRVINADGDAYICFNGNHKDCEEFAADVLAGNRFYEEHERVEVEIHNEADQKAESKYNGGYSLSEISAAPSAKGAGR